VEDEAAQRFDTLIAWVQAIRSLRVDLSIPEGAEIEVFFDADEETTAWLRDRVFWLGRLAKVRRAAPRWEAWPERSRSGFVKGIEFRIAREGVVNREELVAKLRKQEEKLAAERSKLQARLSNERFLARAPAEV